LLFKKKNVLKQLLSFEENKKINLTIFEHYFEHFLNATVIGEGITVIEQQRGT